MKTRHRLIENNGDGNESKRKEMFQLLLRLLVVGNRNNTDIIDRFGDE
jgi:hypothetical protein